MAMVSSCPTCTKPVSLPEVPPASRVRCPECRAEFELQAALDRLPPLVEVVELAVAEEDFSRFESGVSSLAGVALSGAAAAHQGAEAASAAELPLDAGAEASLDLDDLDTELENRTSSLDALPEFAEAADTPAPEDELTFADTTDETTIPLAEADDTDPFGTVDTGTAASSDDNPFGEQEEMPGFSAAASAARRRKREPSFIGNLIGIVGGGVVGCGLAYFIVLWVGGPEKDFLELGPKLPAWILPSSFSKSPLAKSSKDGPAPVTPMTSEPTADDLDEVREAGGLDEPGMKLNVPPLSEQLEGQDISDIKLPFDTDDGTEDTAAGLLDTTDDLTEDLANELSDDTLTPPSVNPAKPPVKAGDADDALTDDSFGETDQADKPDTSADDLPTGSADDFATAGIGPKEHPQYTAADLKTALEDVETMHRALSATKPGDKAARNIKRQFYTKVYQLGDVVTYVTGDDAALAETAEQLAQMTSDPAQFNEIGKNGASWMKLDADRREGVNGVLLAGEVKALGRAGELHRLVLRPPGSGAADIVVLSPNATGLAAGDSALVFGSIVTDPQASLHNYDGDDERVIWHGLSIKAGQ